MEISEDYQAILARMCGIKEHETLPSKVVELFWQYKRIQDRCGNSIIPDFQLANICLMAGVGVPKSVDEKIVTILDLATNGKVKRGDEVRVKWRDDVKPAKFQNVTGRKMVKVILEGETDTREFHPEAFVLGS
jgi:hypothetical protein